MVLGGLLLAFDTYSRYCGPGKQCLQPCVAKIMAATPLSLGEITPCG